SVPAAFPHFCQRIFCGSLILIVVDRDPHALFRQGQRDATTNAARAPGHESVLCVCSHTHLLRGRMLGGCKTGVNLGELVSSSALLLANLRRISCVPMARDI